MTLGICGPNGSGSSASAGRRSSSESKSRDHLDSNGYLVRMKTCKGCGTEKPYSEFLRDSKRRLRKLCKACTQYRERERKRKRKTQENDNHRRWRERRRGHALVSVARQRARDKSLPCTLNPHDVQNRVDAGRCELTGIPFNLKDGKTWDSPSLDRIDSKKGYTPENTRVVLYCVNVMANIWGANKIVEIANAIMDQRRHWSDCLQNSLEAALKKRLPIVGPSPEYEMTWGQVVTPSGRRIPRLRASARRTSGNGSGSSPIGWVSPTAQDGARGALPPRPHDTGIPLSQQVALAGWPAPKQRDHHTEGPGQYSPSLARVAEQTAGWPTPNVPNGGRSITHAEMKGSTAYHHGKKVQVGLEAVAKMAGWATPRHTDGSKNVRTRDGALKEAIRKGGNNDLGTTASLSPAPTAARGGSLNPAFSRWLMGYPAAWGNCAPTAMPSSRRSRQSSSGPIETA